MYTFFFISGHDEAADDDDEGREADSEDSDGDADDLNRYGLEYNDDEEEHEKEEADNTGSESSIENTGKCNFSWICNFFQY